MEGFAATAVASGAAGVCSDWRILESVLLLTLMLTPSTLASVAMKLQQSNRNVT